MGAALKGKCIVAPKVGNAFSYMDGHIMGVNAALYTNDLIVQKWRMSDWPEEHYSTVKYKLKPCIINDSDVSDIIKNVKFYLC